MLIIIRPVWNSLLGWFKPQYYFDLSRKGHIVARRCRPDDRTTQRAIYASAPPFPHFGKFHTKTPKLNQHFSHIHFKGGRKFAWMSRVPKGQKRHNKSVFRKTQSYISALIRLSIIAIVRERIILTPWYDIISSLHKHLLRLVYKIILSVYAFNRTVRKPPHQLLYPRCNILRYFFEHRVRQHATRKQTIIRPWDNVGVKR